MSPRLMADYLLLDCRDREAATTTPQRRKSKGKEVEEGTAISKSVEVRRGE